MTTKKNLNEYEVLCLKIAYATLEKETLLNPAFETISGQEDYREGVRNGYQMALELLENYINKL